MEALAINLSLKIDILFIYGAFLTANVNQMRLLKQSLIFCFTPKSTLVFFIGIRLIYLSIWAAL